MNLSAAARTWQEKWSTEGYAIEEQIGFVLRCVTQRHAGIFAEQIGGEFTPTQWTTLVKLAEIGPCAQNELSRVTAVDIATIKGVVDRLVARGLIRTATDPEDGRRLLIGITAAGYAAITRLLPKVAETSRRTLAPLSPKEREKLISLLSRIK